LARWVDEVELDILLIFPGDVKKQLLAAARATAFAHGQMTAFLLRLASYLDLDVPMTTRTGQGYE
jgi:hypothetical protein